LVFSADSAQKNADIRQYACIFYDFSHLKIPDPKLHSTTKISIFSAEQGKKSRYPDG
jgi:hypothetical protein